MLYRLCIFLACLAGLVQAAQASWSYNEQTAKDIVRYAGAAYNDAPGNCDFADADFELLDTFKHTPPTGAIIFGYVGISKSSKHMVLAFRGTDGVSQLITELMNSEATEYPGVDNAHVVTYFYGAYGGIKDDVISSVTGWMTEYSGYKLYITGHSLGASLGAMAAMDLASFNPYYMSFGEPRTGDWRFSQEFDKRIPNSIRVTHRKDSVVHVVPCPTSEGTMVNGVNTTLSTCYPDSNKISWPSYGYHHLEEIYYPGDMPNALGSDSGSYQSCTGTPRAEDPTCADQYSLAISVSDHTHYFDIDVGYYCDASNLRSRPLQPDLDPAVLDPANYPQVAA